MRAMPPAVLMIAPAWRLPHLSSLALGTLCPLLRGAGIEVDELHGSLLFPKPASPFHTLENYSRYLFVPSLTGCDVERLLDEVVRDALDEASLKGILVPTERVSAIALGIDEVGLRDSFRKDIASAGVCLERTFERMMAQPYDVIGFSATFDDQVPASLALARRIKEARPGVKIILGGAACFEEQGDGLVASFPELDAVCHTEGEGVIVPLIRALLDGAPLEDVPGIAWRDATGRPRHNPSPVLLRDLDELPVPDYHAYVEQYAASHWASELPCRLMFETSRGCWWGQKSLCSFCGLNAEGLAFRAKSPERAFDEIEHLWSTYPLVRHLQAADNIVDTKYLSTLFPRLAAVARDPERPLRMFYEVKSNMRLEQIEAMAAAGVDRVQPGIESFSDGVLDHMRKGCTALGQVQFLKWSYQAGIDPLYNVIIRNPGDRVEWYQEMLALLPALTHLPPPTSIVTMHLERFSPYHLAPESFGITNVRPRPSYRLLYPGEGVDLGRIAYQFDYDHASHGQEDLLAAYRECADFMMRWRDNFQPDLLVFADEGHRLVLVDRRDGRHEVAILAGPSAQIFLYLDRHRSRGALAEAFPQLDARFIDTLLLSWTHKRWICRNGDRYLAVVPRKGPAVMRAPVMRAKSRKLAVASASL